MKKKGAMTNLILILALLVGLSLVLYPSFSDYWNSVRQTQVIHSYAEDVANLDNEQHAAIMEEAKAFNQSLLERDNGFTLTEEQKLRYPQMLNVMGNGIIGFIDIPSIGIYLPIYNDISESVLQVAIGHLDWTSLPTGGESTHCVVSGHRGLPSARLFTDLDQLAVGDHFMLNVLAEVLTYEVDQILIVEPDNSNDLLIQEGKDLCTLVTCTPYGVNSHRLLIRGHRVDNLAQAQVVRVTADAVVVERLVVAPFVLMPILLLMLMVLLITTRKRRNQNEKISHFDTEHLSDALRSDDVGEGGGGS